MTHLTDTELYDLYHADPYSEAGREMARRIQRGTWTLGETA